jgi:hypothetical protein
MRHQLLLRLCRDCSVAPSQRLHQNFYLWNIGAWNARESEIAGRPTLSALPLPLGRRRPAFWNASLLPRSGSPRTRFLRLVDAPASTAGW